MAQTDSQTLQNIEYMLGLILSKEGYFETKMIEDNRQDIKDKVFKAKP